MAGTNDKNQGNGGSPIEAVTLVRAAGAGMLTPPWGQTSPSVHAAPDSGRHVLIDWKRRAVVFELRNDSGELQARRYTPLEQIDIVDVELAP